MSTLLADTLRKLRTEKGLTQTQLANLMYVNKATISKWESGEYNFTINTLNEICDKLGLDFNPEPYDPYRAKNQFKIINIRTASGHRKMSRIPTDLCDSYPERTEKVWTIA